MKYILLLNNYNKVKKTLLCKINPHSQSLFPSLFDTFKFINTKIMQNLKEIEETCGFFDEKE